MKWKETAERKTPETGRKERSGIGKRARKMRFVHVEEIGEMEK